MKKLLKKLRGQDVGTELKSRYGSALATYRRLCEDHIAGKAIDIGELEQSATTLGIRNVASQFDADCRVLSEHRELADAAASEREHLAELARDFEDAKSQLPDAEQKVASLMQRIDAFQTAALGSGWAETRLSKLEQDPQHARLFASEAGALQAQQEVAQQEDSRDREMVAAAAPAHTTTLANGQADWVEDDD
jgi:hypothetical protein